MQNSYASAALQAILLTLCLSSDTTYAAFPDASDAPEIITDPQGNDPAGADDGEQMLPPRSARARAAPAPVQLQGVATATRSA